MEDALRLLVIVLKEAAEREAMDAVEDDRTEEHVVVVDVEDEEPVLEDEEDVEEDLDLEESLLEEPFGFLFRC